MTFSATDREIHHDVAELLVRYATGIDQNVVYVTPGSGVGVDAAGYDDDDLARTGDGWRIARRRSSMVYSAATEPPPGGVSRP